MAYFHLLLLSVFVILCSAAKGENTTILLVQTLSRHGDRAPSVLYPTDPNIANCWHNGVGRLTELGKKQQLEVGRMLRSLYRDFLSPDCKQIYVNSSGEDRCLESAAFQLATFCGATRQYTKHLDWQPIPIHHLPPKLDKYFSYKVYCPRAEEEYSKVINTKENEENQNQKATMEELSKLSGLDFSNPLDAYNLFLAIQSERTHNCTVPVWANEYYDVLKHAYDEVLMSFYASPDQIRLRFGPFLGLINNNLKNKIKGKTDLQFVINISHDVQVAGVLAALNFTNILHPLFCATLLFELHEMTDTSLTVRLRYMNNKYLLNYQENQPAVLVLDGCTEFCPVDYFMKSYQWLIPDNWEEECQTDKFYTSDIFYSS